MDIERAEFWRDKEYPMDNIDRTIKLNEDFLKNIPEEELIKAQENFKKFEILDTKISLDELISEDEEFKPDDNN